jgi:integrase
MEALAQLDRCLKPKRLTDVDRKGVEKFMAMRAKEVRPATVNKQLRTLRAIFRKATKRGYLKDSPFDHVEKLREPEKHIRILHLEEIPKLFLAAPSLRWRAFICLALTTGMRLGELSHLEWDDVDLEHGVVTIENKQGWQTKSRKIRKLALVPAMASMLRQLERETNARHVFSTCDGDRMRYNVHRAFRCLLRKAGIQHCSVHDLRRTFVSYLAMSGVNEAIVQRLAGHASIATTLRHYTHILPESLRQAQESLPYSRAESPMLTLCGPGPKDAPEATTA